MLVKKFELNGDTTGANGGYTVPQGAINIADKKIEYSR
jgi:hypothetical protein